MSSASRRVFFLLAALYLVFYLIWLVSGALNESERYLLGNLALLFSGAACTWSAFRAWKLTPPEPSLSARRAWLWLSFGLAVWLAADALRMLREGFTLGRAGQQNILDLIFTLGSLAVLGGLLLYPRRPPQERSRSFLRILLDATVVSTAVITLSWILVLAPIFDAGGPPLVLLYPAADLVLLVVLVNLFIFNEPGSFPAPLYWLSLGLAAYLTSDLAYASLLRDAAYSAGGPADFGWALGDFFFILAGAEYIRTANRVARPTAAVIPRRAAARVQSLLPLVTTLGLGWISIASWQLQSPGAQLGPWITVVLALVIIARQGISAGEVEFEQYARLVNGIAEPAFICDRNGRLRLVNPAFVQISGYENAGAMAGLPLQVILRPAQDVARILVQGFQEHNSGSGWDGGMFLSRKDGQLVAIQLALRPVTWRRGAPALAGTAHDLTEINRQQAALQQAYEQLAAALNQLEKLNTQLEQRVQEKTADLKQAYDQLELQNAALRSLDRLKSDFVSMVSHELRAPLTNINGGIELVLARSRSLVADERDTLGLVQAEIARLTRFVETILDLSALDAGRAPLYPAPLRMETVFAALRRQMMHLPGADRVTWILPIDAPDYLADERAMTSILFHLVDNAMKYAPDGPITVSAGQEGGMGWVRVEDRGQGIPDDALPMLFTRFYRSNSADAQTVYGHGLGLYIARRLIEAMDGTIEAANRPEGGAKFLCRLPLVIEESTGEENELENLAG